MIRFASCARLTLFFWAIALGACGVGNGPDAGTIAVDSAGLDPKPSTDAAQPVVDAGDTVDTPLTTGGTDGAAGGSGGGEGGAGGGSVPSCGGPGYGCCPGNTCSNNGCCISGVCASPGAICGALGGVCNAGACGTCGGAGLPCCTGSDGTSTCTAPATRCSAGLCIACGSLGLPCCMGVGKDTCLGAGLVCNSNLCVADPGPVDAGVDATPTGGVDASIGTGGTAGTAGGAGGTAGSGGVAGTGGTAGSGGVAGAGGTAGSGGVAGAGGTAGSGGVAGAGGTAGSGGVAGAGGSGGAGGSPYPNRIINGDFSNGLSYWHVTDSSGYAVSTGAVQYGAYCIDGESSGLNVGWPISVADAIYLQPRGRYRLSFRVQASESRSVTLGVKVGQVALPYTAVYTVPTFYVPTGWNTYSYDFTAGSTTIGAGIVFIVYPSAGSVFCVDDVSLVFQGV